MAVTNKMVMEYTMRMGITETPQFKTGWGRVTKKMEKSIAPIFKKAFDAGFSPRQMSKIDQQFKKSTGELRMLFGQLQSVRDTLALKGLTAEEKKRFEMIEADTKASIRAKTKLRKMDAKNVTDIMNRKKKAEAAVGDTARKWYSQGVEELGSGLHGVFQDVTSKDLPQMVGALKRVGSGLEKMGQVAQTKEGLGTAGKAMGGLGSFLTKVGPALIAIGAVVAGFAAIVKVLLDADSAAKELNRGLLESGMAGADLVGKFGDVNATLSRTRRTFAEAFKFNNVWGTTAKDHLAILGAFAEAGQSFRQIQLNATKAKDETEALMDATSKVLTYSKLLSISTQEMTAHMGGYMEDLGLSLEGVSERFSSIIMAAQQSGFATKRFFGQVLQATTGMSMYNVRLEEAGALLVHLNKAIGQKGGGAKLQELTKGYKEASPVELTQKALMIGIPEVLKVSRRETVGIIEGLRDQIGQQSEEGAKAVWDVLSKSGMTKGMSGEEMLQQFSKLNQTQQSVLVDQFEQVNRELGRQFGQAMQRGEQVKGGGLGGAIMGLQGMGPGGTLVMMNKSLKQVMGKDISAMSKSERTYMPYLEMISRNAGMSVASLKEHLAIMDSWQAKDFQIRQKQTELSKLQGDERDDWLEKNNKILAKDFGVALDKDGKRVRATLDEVSGALTMGTEPIGESMDDLVLSLGDRFKDVIKDQVKSDEQIAKDIAAETTDVTKAFEQTTEYLLSNINEAVQWIRGFLGDRESLGAKGIEARTKAVDTLAGRIAELKEKRSAKSEEISKAQREMIGADEPRKKKLQEKIDMAREERDIILSEIDTKKKQIDAVRKMKTHSDVGSSKPEDEAGITPEAKEARESLAKKYPTFMKIMTLGVPGKGQGAEDFVKASEDIVEEDKKNALRLAKGPEKKINEKIAEDQSKDIKEGAWEVAKRSLRAKQILDMVQSTGLSEAEQATVAQALSSGVSDIDSVLKDAGVTDEAVTGKVKTSLEKSGYLQTASPAQDELLKINGQGQVDFRQRVGAGDLLAAVNPRIGAGAGAGGGAVMHNHFYQDGEGNWATLKKGLEALDIV